MDFLDPKKQKTQIRRLYLGYILMAVAIGLGALILLFATYGYGVDKDGDVFQNGLVFLASRPDGAQVKINNTANSFQQTATTSDRLVLKANEYNFEFLKKGYRPWKRTVTVHGGGIERLDYPFLFPDKLVTANDEIYAGSPGLTTESPDKKTILVQKPGTLGTFDVFKSGETSKAPTSFEVPAGIFPAGTGAQTAQLVEWSSDNRHLLVAYGPAGQQVYILIDSRQPENSKNLNTLFAVSPTKLRLRDKNPEKFYMLKADKQLVSAQIDGTVTPVASDVVAFAPHGNTNLLYVTDAQAATTNKATVIIRSNDTNYHLRDLPVDSNYLLDLAQYKDRWFVVAGASADENVYVYRDPVDTIKRKDAKVVLNTRTLHIKNAGSVAFSANSRFIEAQSGQRFAVYDAEQDRQYKYDITAPFDDAAKVSWMDGHRIIGSSGGKLVVFDFDGINQQILSPIQPGTRPLFNDSYKELYSVTNVPGSTDRFVFTRTDLEIKN